MLVITYFEGTKSSNFYLFEKNVRLFIKYERGILEICCGKCKAYATRYTAVVPSLHMVLVVYAVLSSKISSSSPVNMASDERALVINKYICIYGRVSNTSWTAPERGERFISYLSMFLTSTALYVFWNELFSFGYLHGSWDPRRRP